MALKSSKIAFVSDKLAGNLGGAESVLYAAIELIPNIQLYTTMVDYELIPEKYKDLSFNTTILQDMPFSKKFPKAYFPLMPMAIEDLNLQEYDIILSSHHSVAKGIIPRPDACHICYCHSPARYIWDMSWTYSNLYKLGSLKRLLSSIISHYIRIWDVTSSDRVDLFLANSTYTAQRIKKFYRRDAEILHPPVDISKFKYDNTHDFYLMAGRLVPYKGYDLAIESFNESGKNLIIIGEGPEYETLKRKASSNIKLIGYVPDEKMVWYMNNCKGFVFPGKEDFGIVMAEAQAAGKPVIAYGAGGALDIIKSDETGVLFKDQTVQSLNHAVLKAETMNWDHNFIIDNSKRFDKQIFIQKLKFILENTEDLKQKYSFKSI